MSGRAVGVGLGPRNRISEESRQDVLDAGAVLQARRSEVAADLARGEVRGAEVVCTGYDETEAWFSRAVSTWSELLSVRPAATAPQLRVSLPVNRRQVDRGLKMVSVFDHDGLDPDARLLVATEQLGTYLFAFAPVQMKLVDRRSVLLQGPFAHGEPSVMEVRAPAVMDAAWRYWNAVTGSSFPAADEARDKNGLTPRQVQIVALLAADTRDEAIASALEISVRTVRSDIAHLMAVLGVRTRFAAGLRLQEVASRDAPPPPPSAMAASRPVGQ